MPGIVLSPLHIKTYLILTTNLQNRYYYHHHWNITYIKTGVLYILFTLAILSIKIATESKSPDSADENWEHREIK